MIFPILRDMVVPPMVSNVEKLLDPHVHIKSFSTGSAAAHGPYYMSLLMRSELLK
jgi:hypothetical protein